MAVLIVLVRCMRSTLLGGSQLRFEGGKCANYDILVNAGV
jgi:hypothetical protein